MRKKLLIIDDEENMRHMLKAMLSRSGFTVETAADGMEGLSRIRESAYDFVLCDLKMPKMNGMEFLRTGREELKNSTVIMMSAYGSTDTALEAMKHGAYDYISKPFKTDEVYLTLKKAEERESLKKENLRLKERIKKIEEKYRFGHMVARSRNMQEVFDLAEKVSRYDTTVLITGESGTGKELVARGIHYSGNRANMSLISVNCGGIPETLLESEFFGYKKGAFTGANQDKKGLFEEANKGTIFLDEIGELPMNLQVKLLRVLQESEIRRVGDSREIKIDVRIIAATARDLQEEVNRGNFRQDLFYRLNVMPIKIPPLRKRKEDIPLLADYFRKRCCESLHKSLRGIDRETMTYLENYSWPGNVRELENVVERACVLTDGDILGIEDFPEEVKTAGSTDQFERIFDGFSLKNAQRILEKKLIEKALTETGGNRTQASRLLEISHPSLLSKIKTYEIDI